MSKMARIDRRKQGTSKLQIWVASCFTDRSRNSRDLKLRHRAMKNNRAKWWSQTLISTINRSSSTLIQIRGRISTQGRTLMKFLRNSSYDAIVRFTTNCWGASRTLCSNPMISSIHSRLKTPSSQVAHTSMAGQGRSSDQAPDTPRKA